MLYIYLLCTVLTSKQAIIIEFYKYRDTRGLKQCLVARRCCKRPKYKGPSSIDCRERESIHGVCIPHRIPRVWVKQEEEADTRKIVKE